MKIKALMVLACLLSITAVARGEPLSRNQVPEPLRPWTDWVLRGHEDQFCPVDQSPTEEHRCVWPSRLTLTIDETSGRFAQDFGSIGTPSSGYRAIRRDGRSTYAWTESPHQRSSTTGFRQLF